MKRLVIVCSVALSAWKLGAQSLVPGDVLVSTYTSTSQTTFISRLLVYGGDGSFKREFANSTDFSFRETLVHNGILYVGTDNEIKRFDLTGSELPVFNSEFQVSYLSPAADGSLIASRGEIFHFNEDGSRRAALLFPRTGGSGVDLDADQCSVYYIGGQGLRLWNACTDAGPTLIGLLPPGSNAYSFRILPDGSMLAAVLQNLVRLDRTAAVLQTYDLGNQVRAVAIDTGRTSFWTGAAGTLFKVSIATGATELATAVGEPIRHISVVGEPRAALVGAAAIPALSTWMLAFLATTLVVFGWWRSR